MLVYKQLARIWNKAVVAGLNVPVVSDGSVESPRKALVKLAGLRAENLTPDP
jgi:hypothetical protein